jgi:hypothetical protein
MLKFIIIYKKSGMSRLLLLLLLLLLLIMRWAGHVARMERRGKCTGFCWESQKETDHLKDHGVDGRVGSEWILGRLAGECTVDPVGSG